MQRRVSLMVLCHMSKVILYLLVPLPDLPQVVDVELRFYVLLPVEGDEWNLEETEKDTHTQLKP